MIFRIERINAARFICRLIIAFVFLFAGTRKLLVIGDFAATIEATRLVPPAFSHPIATAIALSESLAGAAFLAGRTRRWAGYFLIFLLTLFSGVTVLEATRGASGECGCFGGYFEAGSAWLAAGRNVLLIALTAFAAGTGQAAEAEPPTT